MYRTDEALQETIDIVFKDLCQYKNRNGQLEIRDLKSVLFQRRRANTKLIRPTSDDTLARMISIFNRKFVEVNSIQHSISSPVEIRTAVRTFTDDRDHYISQLEKILKAYNIPLPQRN